MSSRSICAFTGGQVSLRKPRPLDLPQFLTRAIRHEQADPALHLDQILVLKRLISLGDGQRIGALVRREAAHGGKGIAVPVGTIENRCGNHIAQAKIDGFLRIGHDWISAIRQ